ncbi:MAG: PIG-L domain-containing protein [Bacteroidetes bacterium]|nr:MAG: PIG-L domain-containing protein [Bacteroidota bacterium]
MTKKRILIIAPHKDDEVLGCGGLIAKSIELGHSVWVIIVTSGYVGDPEIFPKEVSEKTVEECKSAHRFLGVEETFFLDFPCPRLDTSPQYKISMAIEKIIRQKEISELYLPHRGDVHVDHRVTYDASLVAARPINNNPVRNIFVYETQSETEWSSPHAGNVFIPQVFVGLTEEQMAKKLKAFEFFKSQQKKAPHPRSLESIHYLAKMRGATVNKFLAEAFMVVRQIES